MPLEEVSLIVSSILVAKETGGELTRVFSRLVDTIRDKIKLKEKIDTLTLQGKLQGYIMSCLPFVFTIFVYKQNPEHFLVFRDTQTGKMMIIIAVVLQIVGMVLIKVFGKLKV
jgi:tight adherence protein B